MTKLLFIIGYVVLGIVIRRFLIAPKVKNKIVILPVFHIVFIGYLTLMQLMINKGTDADFFQLMKPFVIATILLYLLIDFYKGLKYFTEKRAVEKKKNSVLKQFIVGEFVFGGVFLFLFTFLLSGFDFEAFFQSNTELYLPAFVVLLGMSVGCGILCLILAVQNFFTIQKNTAESR